MNEMIERVAREICCDDPDKLGRFTCDDGTIIPKGQPAWMSFVERAKRIIAVMREPTEEMMGPGTRGLDIHLEQAACAWRNMIDAARGALDD